MKFVNSLGRKRSTLVVVLLLACVGFAGFGIWRISAFQRNAHLSQKPSENEIRDAVRVRMQRGVGGQVKLAVAGDSEERVKASVDSAARFISERADLFMSAETKNRLVHAEQAVLNGNGQRISVDQLTDTLTAIVTNRLSALNDRQLVQAADSFRPNSKGQITARANGQWGYLTREQFIAQAKAGRMWSRRGDAALKISLRSMIDEEVRVRVQALVTGLPEQFGSVTREGATPLQALLISYSLAADDSLENSQTDLRNQIVQKRMVEMQTRPTGPQNRDSGKAYGLNGFIHASPVNLFFDRAAIDQLLTNAEGGIK